MEYRKLSNGVEIPVLGFGTWQTKDGETAVNAVKAAIESGYRHIDCAPVYQNENSVGEGIKASGIKREELFVTSKVWNEDRGRFRTIAACERSLKDLGLDYFDLYLIHWPASPKDYDCWEELNRDTWRGMIDLYKMGKVRAIGVSNFYPHHLKSLLDMEVIPMVDQIEYHPGQTTPAVVQYCKGYGIAVEAYSPLGTGKVLQNETLQQIAEKYGKSVAQITLRWELQNGIIVIPKSTNPERIRQNLDVFDFVLNDEDMATIDALPFIGGSGHHPDTVRF